MSRRSQVRKEGSYWCAHLKLEFWEAEARAAIALKTRPQHLALREGHFIGFLQSKDEWTLNTTVQHKVYYETISPWINHYNMILCKAEKESQYFKSSPLKAKACMRHTWTSVVKLNSSPKGTAAIVPMPITSSCSSSAFHHAKNRHYHLVPSQE